MFNPSLKPFFVQPRMGKETLRFSNAWHSWNSPSVFRGATDVGGRCIYGGFPDRTPRVLLVHDEYLMPLTQELSPGWRSEVPHASKRRRGDCGVHEQRLNRP
jgi:hypothetical protein